MINNAAPPNSYLSINFRPTALAPGFDGNRAPRAMQAASSAGGARTGAAGAAGAPPAAR
jgi:hypothetical protein